MKLIRDWGRWTPTKKNRNLFPHKNPGLEMVYVARGEVEWMYEGRRLHNRPGTLVMSWPWEEHGHPAGTLSQCQIYWLLIPLGGTYSKAVRYPRFSPALNMKPATERIIATRLRALSCRSLTATPLAAELMQELVRELDHPGEQHEARIRSMLNLLLLELSRWPTTPVSQGTVHGADERVMAFIAGLEHRCEEAWTLESMAEQCGLGRTRFANLVAHHTGDTPLRLLNRLRVKQAGRMLRESSHTITTIGFECGFHSSQYFARVFREFTGQAPSDWRREEGE